MPFPPKKSNIRSCVGDLSQWSDLSGWGYECSNNSCWFLHLGTYQKRLSFLSQLCNLNYFIFFRIDQCCTKLPNQLYLCCTTQFRTASKILLYFKLRKSWHLAKLLTFLLIVSSTCSSSRVRWGECWKSPAEIEPEIEGR